MAEAYEWVERLYKLLDKLGLLSLMAGSGTVTWLVGVWAAINPFLILVGTLGVMYFVVYILVNMNVARLKLVGIGEPLNIREVGKDCVQLSREILAFLTTRQDAAPERPIPVPPSTVEAQKRISDHMEKDSRHRGHTISR